MCGIITYKGKNEAAPILLKGLKRLEYRGYDSAGMAVLGDGRIDVRKNIGKVAEVEVKEKFLEMKGNAGIAHTRWATTGEVTKENAHPHALKRMAIVHNGIVENYQQLKENLVRKGHAFISNTDTEVILCLIAEERKDKALLQAVSAAFGQLRGRNAFVVLSESGSLIAARKGSPLLLGIADHGMLLASDASPLLDHTRNVVFLDDNEIVQLDGGWEVYDAHSLERKEKEVEEVTWTLEQAQKGEYEHFMLKEIMEQKNTIRDALMQDRQLVMDVASAINGAFGTYVVGCGTAGKVALASTYIFSRLTKKHLNFALGSEFPNYHDFLTKDSLLIAISQSGETADTLEAIETLQGKNGKIVSIVNVLGSTMDRTSDWTLPVLAGPEQSVCSTKSTTNQLVITYLLAYACSGRYEEGLDLLRRTADAVDDMLCESFLERIRSLAGTLNGCDDMYIIGRGLNYPMALEAAIKIQEVSYIHAEGFAGGELKHGPIALVEKGTPLIVFAPNDETYDGIISNALEVKARGGRIIGISPNDNRAFDDWIEVPDIPETSPILNIIPIQLLSYYLAVLRGNDVDQPRNLAKSVTVK